MQLSARILTALAVLAFTVAIVAGARSATDEVSAATGTIDALNVGVCTTTNTDDFDLGDCTQTDAFYQQGRARGSDRGRNSLRDLRSRPQHCRRSASRNPHRR